MALCAALCCYGYQIEATDKDQVSRKTFFLIRKDKKVAEIINLYFTHQLKVDPLSYFNFLKEIKTRIYNA